MENFSEAVNMNIMNKHFSARVESYSLGLTLYLAYIFLQALKLF